MIVRVADAPESVTVFLSGDIDLEHSPEARKALLAAFDKKRTVIADLHAVNYLDSSGVASLVEAYQRAQSLKVPFVLARVSEPARRVLALARLDKVFTIQ